jgi:coenzyme F420-0:L-glutamate ligase / coenzyme F420-1:gamma-L-glutamate ligase
VLVVTSKAVSKVEGRQVRLAEVTPGERAQQLATEQGKDARLVQVILDESAELLRARNGVLICETRHGFVCANAGVDVSNVPGDDVVLLLPIDPDASARSLREGIAAARGVYPALLIGDSFGRAWRLGQAEVAIGCAGLRPLDDWRGRSDAGGRQLEATLIAVADEAASAADLVRDKASGVPAAVVRGLGDHLTDEDGPGAAALRRPPDEDLFR